MRAQCHCIKLMPELGGKKLQILYYILSIWRYGILSLSLFLFGNYSRIIFYLIRQFFFYFFGAVTSHTHTCWHFSNAKIIPMRRCFYAFLMNITHTKSIYMFYYETYMRALKLRHARTQALNQTDRQTDKQRVYAVQ